MATRYANRMLALVGRFIRRNGTTAVITRQRLTAYDGTTGVATPDNATQSVKGLWREVFDKQFGSMQPGQDATTVRGVERRFIVLYKSFAFDPLTQDLVTIAGQPYNIAADGIIRRYQNDVILYLELKLELA